VALRVSLVMVASLLSLAMGCGNREYRWYSEDEMCWHYGDEPPDYPARDECCATRRWHHSDIRYHKETAVCWHLPECSMCLWPEFDVRENPEPFDSLMEKWSNGPPPDGFCPYKGRRWRLPQYVNMANCP